MGETMTQSHSIELLVQLSPGLVLAGLLVVLLGVYAARAADGRAGGRRDGSILVPRLLIGFWYWLVTPIIDRLADAEIRPNHITLASLYIAALAAACLGAGFFMLGTWLLIAAASCDLLDGLLARRTDTGSKAGAFLDSFADRAAEGMVFGGIAFYGAGGPLTWVAVWAMLASILVSYARARGEALGVDCKVGLMQRPERLLWLIITLFLAPIGAIFTEAQAARPDYWVAIVGVGLLALLSTVTAVRRAAWIVRELDTSPPRGQAEQPAEEYPLESNAGAAS